MLVTIRPIEAVKLEMLEERIHWYGADGYLCEHCHERPATDFDHIFFGRRKEYPELDVKYNGLLSCNPCNVARVGNNRDFRQLYWTMQCERYGAETMLEWLESIPYKLTLTHRIDFVS